MKCEHCGLRDSLHFQVFSVDSTVCSRCGQEMGFTQLLEWEARYGHLEGSDEDKGPKNPFLVFTRLKALAHTLSPFA